MCGIRIREALPKDLDAIYEIEKQSFKDPYPSAFINFLYDVNRRTFLVAEKDGAVIGYVIASAERDIGHIISVAVHPSERRRHIGRAIMGEVLKTLKDTGVATVRLEVRQSNAEAQRFYESLGFRRSYTLDNYYGEEDALVYFKPL